jgi:hypothetical protein
MCNSGGTAGNGILDGGLCQGVIRKATGARIQQFGGSDHSYRT